MTHDEARQLIEAAKNGQGSMADAIDQIWSSDLTPSQREAVGKELGLYLVGKAHKQKIQWQQQLGVETPSEKRERVTAAAATRGLTPNRYAGRCVLTGERVEKGEGFTRKASDGKSWDVYSFAAVAEGRDTESPLAHFSDDELLAEARRRKLID